MKRSNKEVFRAEYDDVEASVNTSSVKRISPEISFNSIAMMNG
jgi:hypothetical protein